MVWYIVALKKKKIISQHFYTQWNVPSVYRWLLFNVAKNCQIESNVYWQQCVLRINYKNEVMCDTQLTMSGLTKYNKNSKCSDDPHSRAKLKKKVLVMSLKYTPATQNILCLILLDCWCVCVADLSVRGRVTDRRRDQGETEKGFCNN